MYLNENCIVVHSEARRLRGFFTRAPATELDRNFRRLFFFSKKCRSAFDGNNSTLQRLGPEIMVQISKAGTLLQKVNVVKASVLTAESPNCNCHQKGANVSWHVWIVHSWKNVSFFISIYSWEGFDSALCLSSWGKFSSKNTTWTCYWKYSRLDEVMKNENTCSIKRWNYKIETEISTCLYYLGHFRNLLAHNLSAWKIRQCSVFHLKKKKMTVIIDCHKFPNPLSQEMWETIDLISKKKKCHLC